MLTLSPIFTKEFVQRVYLGAALFIVIFLSQHKAHGQAFYGSLGPASFSSNWGSTNSIKSSYQPQLVMLKRPTPGTVKTHSLPASYQSESNEDGYAAAPAVSSAPVSVPGFSSLAQPTVPGNRAKLKHGIAYAPENAPINVKRAIWATNTLLRKPYVWGGGHDSFFDSRGYDCSGTVSFALHYAGVLNSPTDSRGLMSFGERGPGRWMTVYARNGHTWMIIAGLRLDTTGFYGDEGPRWRPDSRTPWGFEARHPVGL